MNLFYLYCQLVNANPAQDCSGLRKTAFFNPRPDRFSKKYRRTAYRPTRAMARPDTLNVDDIPVEGLRHDVDGIRFGRRDRATALRAFDTSHFIIVLMSGCAVQSTAVLMDPLCPCCPSRGVVSPRLIPRGVCPHSPFCVLFRFGFLFIHFLILPKRKMQEEK